MPSTYHVISSPCASPLQKPLLRCCFLYPAGQCSPSALPGGFWGPTTRPAPTLLAPPRAPRSHRRPEGTSVRHPPSEVECRMVLSVSHFMGSFDDWLRDTKPREPSSGVVRLNTGVTALQGTSGGPLCGDCVMTMADGGAGGTPPWP